MTENGWRKRVKKNVATKKFVTTTSTEVAIEQFPEIKRYDSQNSMISDAKSLRRNSSD